VPRPSHLSLEVHHIKPGSGYTLQANLFLSYALLIPSATDLTELAALRPEISGCQGGSNVSSSQRVAIDIVAVMELKKNKKMS